MRGWAHQSDAVTARVNAADERRLAAIREMFERFGYASDDADVRARTVYLVQIGYISMQVQESAATRMSRVQRYVEIYSGRSPTASEMARFHARLKFKPHEGDRTFGRREMKARLERPDSVRSAPTLSPPAEPIPRKPHCIPD